MLLIVLSAIGWGGVVEVSAAGNLHVRAGLFGFARKFNTVLCIAGVVVDM